MTKLKNQKDGRVHKKRKIPTKEILEKGLNYGAVSVRN